MTSYSVKSNHNYNHGMLKLHILNSNSISQLTKRHRISITTVNNESKALLKYAI